MRHATIQAMAEPSDIPLTVLLHAWRLGDKDAFSCLVHQVHAELRRMAASRLHGAETDRKSVV